MFQLSRTVRFAINTCGRAPESDESVRFPNGYAGVPGFRGLGTHYELDVFCRGALDPVSGYLINIKDVDAAARATAIVLIQESVDKRLPVEPSGLLRQVLPRLDERLGGSVHAVRWRLTPYYSIEMTKDARNTVLIRQRFEFAASHRLHNRALSEEENRRLYGKCNLPSGHGHNYIVEPCVESPVDAGGAAGITLAELERIVAERVIERFDHKHLNLDLPEFGPAGLNPSVENIARVTYELLAPAIAAAGGEQARSRLRDVTVWETEKTGSTYPV